MARSHLSASQRIDQLAGLKPPAATALFALLDLHGVKYSKTLDGDDGIVKAAARAWQICDEPPRNNPLMQDEVDWPNADKRYKSARVKRQTFRLLKRLGVVDRTFLPERRWYENVICFGEHVPSILSMRHQLIQQWRLGRLRFRELSLLGAPRHISVVKLQELEASYLRMPDARRAEDTLGEEGTFGLRSHTTGVGMWLWWWNRLPLPPDMRQQVEVLDLVAAVGSPGEDGEARSANTWQSLTAWYNAGHFGGDTYLVVSAEPLALFHYQSTRKFLASKGITGATIDLLAGPEPNRYRSISLCLLQLSALLSVLI